MSSTAHNTAQHNTERRKHVGTYAGEDSGAHLLGGGVEEVGEADHGAAQLVAAAVHQLQQHVRAELRRRAASHLHTTIISRRRGGSKNNRKNYM